MNRATEEFELCERLAQQQPAAIAEFGERFSGQLRQTVEDLLTRIPGWRCGLPDLLQAIGRAVGVGYLDARQRTEISFTAYMDSINLPDLMVVAACLREDDVAWRYVQQMAETQVLAGLRKSWGSRVSGGRIDEVANDLCGHCFSPASKGRHAGLQRLVSYRGRASLTTWLHAVAVKTLLDRLQSPPVGSDGRRIDDLVSSPVSTRPDVQARFQEAGSRADAYRTRLISVLRTALEAMPSRRRLAAVLHWVNGRRAAEIATRMNVSRPRITELLSEARRDFCDAARRVCEEIATEAERPIPEIEKLLQEQMCFLLGDAAVESP